MTDVMRRIYDIAPVVRNILVHVQADNCSDNKNKIAFAVQHALCHMAFRQRGVKVRFENNYLIWSHFGSPETRQTKRTGTRQRLHGGSNSSSS